MDGSGNRSSSKTSRVFGIMGRALFVLLTTLAAAWAGGGRSFAGKRTGATYLVLWILWWTVTFIGRRQGPQSGYGRSQKRLVALSGSLMVPLLVLVPPLEHAAFKGPLERDGLLSAVGLLVFAAGILLQTAAMWQLGRHFTVRLGVQPGQKLVTTGLYRHIRHPGYLSYLVTILGMGLALGSLGALVLCAFAAMFTIARIRAEEAMLLKEFGPAYEAYMLRTKRLLPGLY